MKKHFHFLFMLACLLGIGNVSLAQTNPQAGIRRAAIAGSKAPVKTLRIHHYYTYQVTLKDGRVVEFKGRIKPAKTPENFVLAASQQKKEIKPGETLQISRTDAQGQTITGIARKGLWLFPVMSGRINGYSTYAEKEPGYLTHISKAGSSTLIAFNTRTKKERAQTAASLRRLVNGHEAAENLLARQERKDKKKKIANYIALGGLGLTTVAVAAPLFPAFVVGLPAGFGGALVSVAVKPVDLMQVIEVYNQSGSPAVDAVVLSEK